MYKIIVMRSGGSDSVPLAALAEMLRCLYSRCFVRALCFITAVVTIFR
jgi:tRNA(Ile)-lysidine synthase TilS/MesJ